MFLVRRSRRELRVRRLARRSKIIYVRKAKYNITRAVVTSLDRRLIFHLFLIILIFFTLLQLLFFSIISSHSQLSVETHISDFSLARNCTENSKNEKNSNLTNTKLSNWQKNHEHGKIDCIVCVELIISCQ